MSIASTSGIEEVQAASGDGLKFFQMYWRPTRQENRDILDKVERCGFHAIMLTMDSHATLKNCRWRDKRNRFVFPPHIRYVNQCCSPTKMYAYAWFWGALGASKQGSKPNGDVKILCKGHSERLSDMKFIQFPGSICLPAAKMTPQNQVRSFTMQL